MDKQVYLYMHKKRIFVVNFHFGRKISAFILAKKKKNSSKNWGKPMCDGPDLRGAFS